MKKFLMLAGFICFMAFFAISCGEKKEDKPVDKEKPAQVDEKKDAETTPPPAKEEPKDEFADWTKLDAPLKGKLVCMRHFMSGEECKEMQKCANMGGLMGLNVDGKVYILWNKDKTIANKSLAEVSLAPMVAVKGYTKTVKNLECLVIEEIVAEK